MPRLTLPLTLSVDRALLPAYRAASLSDPRLPPPALALDAAMRTALASLGYACPAPLLAPASPGGDRRRKNALAVLAEAVESVPCPICQTTGHAPGACPDWI